MLPVIYVFKIKTPKPESSYFIQKSMTRDPDRQIKCSLRIVALGHRLGFIANSRVSNIESDNSQNVGLEDYNNISDRIFPHFTTPSIKISLG